MEILEQVFSERLQEIETYLDLLAAVEDQVRGGLPRFGTEGAIISTIQQRILYSSVYLQLYNLVEATITKCIESVANAVTRDGRWQPSDLTTDLRREWVRHLARTHVDLNFENRLSSSLEMCEHLILAMPIDGIEIDRGGGGNWNDEEIFRVASRIGCPLTLSPECVKAVKSPFKNDKGALALIVKLRNDLAHGSVSFGECGEGATVKELRDLTTRTGNYLREVVASFQAFVLGYAFLQPTSRPAEGAMA
jgi:hypothetical protein